jgi:hypothetical protein
MKLDEKEYKDPQLLILVSFLVSFAFIRVVTHLQKAGIIPNQTGEFHIHHMVPGIILLIVCGYIGISYWQNEKIRSLVAILFGVGAALTMDEFALWLFLKDVYWAKQGRDSIDAIIIVACVLVIAYVVAELREHNFLQKRIFSSIKKSKKLR